MKLLSLIPILFLLLSSCVDPNPNLNESGTDKLDAKITFVDKKSLFYQDTVYGPVYSDIYSKTKDSRFNLTATLSIRNTSMTDSMYVEDIDYYDTNGKLVSRYIDKVLLLEPLQSVDYVVEEGDVSGGTGANFIVNWGASHSGIRPIIQTVMISTQGQQGISFVTNGVSIKRNPN